jgi:hypothetical protein
MGSNKDIIFKFRSNYTTNYQVEVAPCTWFRGSSDPKLNWKDAKQACADYTRAGHRDWFLPSIDVLRAMQDELHCSNLGEFTVIETGVIDDENSVDVQYWSCTERGIEEAAYVMFDFGSDDDNYAKKSELMYVRPVRIVQDNEEQV